MNRTSLCFSVLSCTAALVASVVVVSSNARADEATGTWTGHIGLRGNYYYERSTRVLAPRADVALESPNGTRLSVDYLIDTITSASVATGVTDDVAFTEVRHEAGASVSHPFALTNGELRLGLDGRISLEPDYDSFTAGVRAQIALADRATTLNLSLSYGHDEARRSVRMLGLDGVLHEVERRCSADTEIDCGLDLVFGGVGLEQVLNRTMVLTLEYDMAFLRGFQWNAYRMVPVQGVPTPEHHPDGRFRNGLAARLVWHVPSTRTTFHIMPRGYIDGWDVSAFSGELRVYQEIEPLLIRLRYRFFAQNESYFFRPAALYEMGVRYLTMDGKMQAFSGHTIGAFVELAMPFLRGTFLDFAQRATIDLSVDYTFQDSVFGNAAQAQIGGRIPF